MSFVTSNRTHALFAGLALAVALATSPTAAQQRLDARSLLESSAAALGGLERIRAINNITLIGYGQYAYMFGGGNITSAVHAPMKWTAANDLRRVYDLANDRFLQSERRNDLFPFGGKSAHTYQPTRLVLDGDVAFNVNATGAATRIGDSNGGGIRWIDGPHMRRMWMLNNPVVAVRAALAANATTSTPRIEGDVMVVDVNDRSRDRYSIGFDMQTRLPAWVRWSNPHDNLGEVTFTTHFSGYVPFNGITLPFGYSTVIDWRDVVYFNLFADGYEIDSKIDDLAAPANVRAAAEPMPQPQQSQVEKVADRIWRIGGTMVVEFEDHLMLFELSGGRTSAQARLDQISKLVPNKRPRGVILSHNHFDHISGIRTAIANGLTIYARRGMEGMLRELAARPAPNYPDLQTTNPQPLKFVPVDKILRLEDKTMQMDINHVVGHLHMADALFAYVPSSKVLIEGDLATAAEELPWWADSYIENLQHYKIDVAILVAAHHAAMTHQQVLDYLAPGRGRIQEWCNSQQAIGIYRAGCPPVFQLTK